MRNTATSMLIGLQNKQEIHLLHQKCIRASSIYRDCDANRRASDNRYMAPSCSHVRAQLCDQIRVVMNVLSFKLSQSSIVIYCQKFVILVKLERDIFYEAINYIGRRKNCVLSSFSHPIFKNFTLNLTCKLFARPMMTRFIRQMFQSRVHAYQAAA